MAPSPSEPGVRVARVPAAATLPLRLAVLRPGRGPESIVEATDDEPDTAFFAVLDGEEVVATVNVRPTPPPFPADPATWWQLRGMATAPEVRGRGHGARVLRAALAHVDGRGGRVWCHARPAAEGLYARAGFVPVGAPWEHPEHGPHRTMAR